MPDEDVLSWLSSTANERRFVPQGEVVAMTPEQLIEVEARAQDVKQWAYANKLLRAETVAVDVIRLVSRVRELDATCQFQARRLTRAGIDHLDLAERAEKAEARVRELEAAVEQANGAAYAAIENQRFERERADRNARVATRDEAALRSIYSHDPGDHLSSCYLNVGVTPCDCGTWALGYRELKKIAASALGLCACGSSDVTMCVCDPEPGPAK